MMSSDKELHSCKSRYIFYEKMAFLLNLFSALILTEMNISYLMFVSSFSLQGFEFKCWIRS